MFITEAYRILVSVKLHGTARAVPSAEQIATAKQVVAEHKSEDALYRKVLRDLAKMGR